MLVSPEGALLDSRLVEALTGHVEYAQAGAATSGAKVVGHVVKMTGSASIVRNGVAVVANSGDTVYQSDVVETGSNSTLGLVLDDGTAFNLSANARFMLNELDYDPTSTSNHSLVSLLQGAATFVAGQVARTGGMEVSTPVAVLGIRGTVVLMAVDGQLSVSVADQQDQTVHSVQIFKCIPAGQGACGAGDLIGTATSNGPSWTLTPTGNFDVTTQVTNKTPDQVTREFSSLQQVLATYDAGKLLFPSLPQHTENANPNSDTGTTKTALGSTPILPSAPPTTTVFSDASSTKVAGSPASTASPTNSGSPAGNGSTASSTSSSDTSQVSTVLLPASAVAINNKGGTTNLKSMTISGTADPGTTVTLLDTFNGATSQIGSTTVNPGGVWTANVTLAGDGVNTIVAQDAGGNATSSPVVFTLDSTPPSVTIIGSGGPTKLTVQTISGSVAAAAGEAAVGSTVTLFDTVNGVTTQVGTAPVDAGGNWSATVTLSGNGIHSIVAQDTDAAGNIGASKPVTFTLAALPTVTIAPVDGNNVINAAEAAAGVALSGTVSGLAANSSFNVTVTDAGVTKTYVATVNAAGTAWSATIPAADATALANGTATVSAQVIDAHGNQASATESVTVAETGPTVTIAPVDNNNVINAAEAAAGVALSGTVSGLAANSSFNVTVTDNGVTKTYVATVNGSGTGWNATIPAADATALANGTATVSAQVTDANGNQASATESVTVAEIGPKVTIAPVDGNNVINAAEAAAGVALSGTVSGLAANSSFNVTVTDAGVTKTYVATVNAAGTGWNATIPAADATVLANGTATVSAQVTDANGNQASATESVTVAETNPTVTIAPVDNNNVINAAEAAAGVALSGTVSGLAANSSFNVTVTDAGVTKTYVATVNGTGTGWNATIPAADATALANGTATVSAQVTDAHGNQASATESVTVAEIGPKVTIANTGGNTNQSAQTISGTADVGDVGRTVNIFDNGGTTPVATTTVQSDGSWSKSVTLVSGTNSLTAQVTDAAGNTGTSNTVVFALPNFTTQWIGPNGGSWSSAANWSAGSVPGPSDDVLIGVSDNVIFSTGSSVIDALFSAVGSTLSVSGGTFTVNNASGSSNLQGSVALSAGTLSTGGQMVIAGITESGGTLTGAGTLTVTGAATFAANGSTQTESGTGTTLVEGGASITSNNSFSLSLSRTLELQGTSTVSGTTGGTIGLGTTGILKIDSGATFDDKSGTAGTGLSITGTAFTGPAVTIGVINDGTWQKTVGAGTTTISAAFSSTGTSITPAIVDVETGTLDLSGGGNDTFTSYTGGGTIDFGGGTRTLDANSSIATANVQFNGGSTTVSGSYSAGTSTTVNGGSADLKNGSAVLGALSMASGGGTLTLESSATATSLTETAGTLTGAGTLTVTGGATFAANGSTQTESGTGTTLVEGGASITSNNSFSLSLSRTLELQGTSTVSGTTGGTIGLGTTGILKIDSGATFDDKSGAAGTGLSITGTAGSSVINAGTWQKTVGAGTTTVSTTFSNTGTVTVQSGTLLLSGAVTNSGLLTANGGNITISGTLADVGTEQLGIANATVELAVVSGGLNVTFGGPNGLLKLDSAVSSSQSAGISAFSINAPTTITGGGSISSTVVDAVDVTSVGGAISLTPGGAVTGALNGFFIVQNGTGDITVTASGPVVGQAGRGIFADVSDTGIGGILVNGSGNVTGSGDGNSGIFAEILNAADGSNVTVDQTGNISGGFDGIRALTQGNGNVTVSTGPNALISGSQEYGIIALSFGTGNLSVSTASNDTIKSYTAGIVAQNDAASIPQVGGITTSSISVTAVGTIDSGSAPTANGFPPAGIIAGYNGTTSGSTVPNAAVFGNVVVNNSANINAAGGDGIRTFNFGNGNITVNDLSVARIATPDRFGISAAVFGAGDISISTVAGDTISSGSTGIEANNNATVIPAAAASTISITAFGTINSGFGLANGNAPAGIRAGYSPGSQGIVNANVQGNVIVDSGAVINAASVGIGLHNFGVGNVTATLESSSAITAALTGVNASAQGGGNVSITNHGTITVATGAGISAGTGNGVANSVSGVVTITNTGAIAALGSMAISVIQINNDSTQGAVFTNSGSVTSQLFSTSDLSEAIAAFSGAITINNSGTISGNVGLTTATFNNNSGGAWNVAGSNSFGNGTNAINNAGTINISDISSFLTASGTLAFNNSGAVNLQADAYALIGGAVSGINAIGGTFSIGDHAQLEFAGPVAAGQTVSFFDGDGLLTLDSPSTFDGTIAGLAIGNTIHLLGTSIASAAISGSVLTVTETNNQTLTYQLAGALSGVTFNVLSVDEIQLVPTTATIITGPSGPLSLTPLTPQFYILSNATISGPGGAGFNVALTDSTLSDFLSANIDATSSISGLSSTFNGVNLTTTGASIGLTNAAQIISAGGRGINTNSGTGSTIVFDTGNVSGATNGINAVTTTGSIEVGLDGGVTITGASTFGISAVSLSGGDVTVETGVGDFITSGSSGINAQDQASSNTANSSIFVSTFGTINSGSTPPSTGNEPAGIKAGFNGGSGAANPAVSGNVIVDNNANITAAGGLGIHAFNDGVGNISVSDGAGTTINADTAGVTAPGAAQVGIGAFSFEAGNIDVTTAFGSTINSGSSGIEAVNEATAVAAAAASSVTVVALGSISSGANATNSGNAPAGIEAGFNVNSAFEPNVNGNVFVDFAGSILAAAGLGIKAFNFGVGNVAVSVEFGSMITATTSATDPNGNNAPFGIGAFNFGPGNIAVTTSGGDVITSGSSGIEAVNEAVTIAASAGAVVTVAAAGTINSGTILTNTGSQPSGIAAGFLGSTTGTPNLNVDGTVIVNNTASIAASAGLGINAFNFGNGDVTVNDTGTTVTGAQRGIVANAESGGTGNVAINVGSGASVTGTSSFGILAASTDDGNVSVTTSSGDVINSGSAGIAAVNQAATVDAGDFIAVVANGTIHSGTAVTTAGVPAAGILASYDPGLANNPDGSVQGDISINDFASIVAPVGTDGISGYNYGTGTVTIVAEAGATITAGRYGIAAFGFDGGDVSVTNDATVSGTTAAIDATTTSTGTATIDNSGSLTGEVISYNASFTNEATGVWSFSGTSAFTGVSNLVNLGAIDSNGTSEISGLSGIANSGTIEVQSGSLKLDAGVSGTGTLTIDAGATLELTSAVSAGQTVVFSSTTGMLKLDQAENFKGVVSGFSTTDGSQADSDQIDLADINHHSSSFSELFNPATDTLTVTDGTNTAVIHFTGTIGTLNFVDDGNLVDGVSGTSGTIVFDPPSTSQAVGPTVVHDRGHVPHDTMAAGEQNQTPGSSAAGDNFAFNFAGVSRATGTDFDPLSDSLHFGKSVFSKVQAALNAAQDEGHGHAAIGVDGHDSITAGGVPKAQLHAADFHIV